MATPEQQVLAQCQEAYYSTVEEINQIKNILSQPINEQCSLIRNFLVNAKNKELKEIIEKYKDRIELCAQSSLPAVSINHNKRDKSKNVPQVPPPPNASINSNSPPLSTLVGPIAGPSGLGGGFDYVGGMRELANAIWY